MSAQTTIKLLFLAANPQETTQLQVDREMRAVDQALRMTTYRERFDLRAHGAVRYSDLQELLLRYQPHIVHFSGHGSSAGELIFESDSGPHSISAEALSNLFAILKDNIRCVVLNACYSAVQAQAIANHIDCVIGMSDAIGDGAASNFAAAYYRALGYGRSIKAAFALGCNAIDLANLVDKDIPQLLAFHANPAQVVLILPDGGAPAEDTAPAPGEPPFKGLQFFDVGDAGIFYGREQWTAELVTHLRQNRFLAVIGASGSGKSSVVRAGLVPALLKGERLADGTFPPAGFTEQHSYILVPTALPLESLASSLTRDKPLREATELIDALSHDPRSLRVYGRRLLAGRASPDRLLLVVDQFEEVFTLCRDKLQRQAFVDNLLAAAGEDGQMVVAIALRADFYAHCAEFDHLREALERQQKYIGPMKADELRRAIEEPAHCGEWIFEPGLVDQLLRDVGEEPGALPLLSHALFETWKRRQGRTLTLRGYAEAGRVQGAIAKTAETVLSERLTTSEQQRIARNIFLRLTELGEGTQDTRRRVDLDELIPTPEEKPMVEAVLRTLADARLVTTFQAEAEVAHEALIREWPRLREWLTENREWLRLQRRLTEVAQEWEKEGHHADLLYRRSALEQTVDKAQGHETELTPLERTFLEASRTALDAAEREKEAARQRELEQAQQLVAEAEARHLAEEQRAQAAEALRKAEEAARQRELKQAKQLATETEARRQAEQERAEQANRDAMRLRQRAWYLASAMVLALGLAGMALYLFGLAQAELARQEGTKLLQTTIELAASGNITEALATYQQALAADPTLPVDAETAITGTLRTTATRLVQEGEDLARRKDHKGASEKFRQALALNSPADTPVYVWIEPGQFIMGSTDEQCKQAGLDGCPPDEQPTHTAKLDGYWILRTEVTNEQYKRCVDADVCDALEIPGWDNQQHANKPVTYVDWSQASQYAAWVGGRLPTEAEWEYACRGTDGRIYPWGNQAPSPDRLNFIYSGIGTAIEVGSYPPGANGLYDMAGNVWEWTADWYDENYYANSPSSNPTGPESGDSRTLRGGSFDRFEDGVRCADRVRYGSDVRSVISGFRVVVLSPGF